MGSLSDVIDFDRVGMAKKVIDHKKHVNGLETPQNSLELPAETFQSTCVEEDIIPYLYHMKSNWPEKQHVTEVPVKKLIYEKTSNKPMTKQNAPSIVARLMGVDTLPSNAKPVAQKGENKYKVHDVNLTEENLSKIDSIGRFSYASKSTRHKRFASVDSIEGHAQNRWSSDRAGDKPKPREHPQEAELQKFKEEFKAWQAARVKEYSKVIELSKAPSQWLAQENLNKEKVVRYANSARMVDNVKPLREKGGGLQNKGMKCEYSAAGEDDSFQLKRQHKNSATKLSFLQNSDQEADSGIASSQIVILRPCLGRTSICKESCLNSPSTSLERGSMEAFLEEVKERLNRELHGKAYRKSATARGGGIETPFSEKPSDPKLIAQDSAKHVRESETRQLGMNLFRTESTKSFGSEQNFKESSTPEDICRDARWYLLGKLKNAMKEDLPLVDESTKSLESNNQRRKTQKVRDIYHEMKTVSSLDVIEDGLGMHSISFHHGTAYEGEIHKELSPRKLTRSLSAPLSGKSFGKLPLEDQHRLTGAHIRRTHEEIQKTTVYGSKLKKEKFNLKEKVTSLKNSFLLRGWLFGRKGRSSGKPNNEYDSMMDSRTSMIFYDRPDNSTEVPPSPASLCISVHEDWQPLEYFSPPSVSGVASPEDTTTPNVFREISSNLKELRRQLKQLETDGSKDAMLDEHSVDEHSVEGDLADVEDQDEAYIRDLLLVSGLYDGSWEKSLSRFDSLGKLISVQFFDKVEESYRQKFYTAKDQGLQGSIKDQGEKLNHKLLFDLVNETLPTLLGSPLAVSKFARYTASPSAQCTHGKKLLDQLWQNIRVYVHPPCNRLHFSLDNMVAQDLKSSSWLRFDDDLSAVGKDIGSQILEDLIDAMLKDM